MGVSCDWLITGKEFAPEVSSSAMEVARKYDALSAGNRLRLEDFLAGLYAADDAAKAKMRRTLPVDTVRKLVGHMAEKMTEYYTCASHRRRSCRN